jgi:hypothetical protein
MADDSNTTTLYVKDLLNLSARLRDRADTVIADRTAADDMRAAADLASRWANFREGWKDPDLSYTAIHELDERLSDYAETGAAVLASDVFLAMLAVDLLCSWMNQIRRFPNAPANFDFREMARTMLNAIGTEPFTVEQWV